MRSDILMYGKCDQFKASRWLGGQLNRDVCVCVLVLKGTFVPYVMRLKLFSSYYHEDLANGGLGASWLLHWHNNM